MRSNQEKTTPPLRFQAFPPRLRSVALGRVVNRARFTTPTLLVCALSNHAVCTGGMLSVHGEKLAHLPSVNAGIGAFRRKIGPATAVSEDAAVELHHRWSRYI